jgi:hypothetical protein
MLVAWILFQHGHNSLEPHPDKNERQVGQSHTAPVLHCNPLLCAIMALTIASMPWFAAIDTRFASLLQARLARAKHPLSFTCDTLLCAVMALTIASMPWFAAIDTRFASLLQARFPRARHPHSYTMSSRLVTKRWVIRRRRSERPSGGVCGCAPICPEDVALRPLECNEVARPSFAYIVS